MAIGIDAVIDAEVVNLDYAWMVEASDGAPFVLKARPGIGEYRHVSQAA